MLGIANKLSWFALAPLLVTTISFISLPVLTLRLGAEDYGVFGLGAVVASLISGIGGQGVLLYLGGQQLDDEQCRSTTLTAVIVALFGGIVISSFITLVWWVGQDGVPEIRYIQTEMMAFIIVIGLCGGFNIVAADIMIHFEAARAHSLCMISQALIFAVTASICVYYWRADALALYAAGAAGALAQCILGVIAIRDYLSGKMSRQIAFELWKVAKPTLGDTYLQVARTFMERWLIGLTSSLHLLGLFLHSQQYRSIVLMVMKVPDKAFWQTALFEARTQPVNFKYMGEVWRLVDYTVFIAGIFFVLVGGDVIGLITHGKFTEAAPFAAIWMAIILTQIAGRAYTSMIIAHGKGHIYSQISLKSNLFVIIGLPISLFFFGLWGFFAVLGMGGIITWALSRHEALKIAQINFPDLRPLSLAIMVVIAQLLVSFIELEVAARGLLLMICIIFFLITSLRNKSIYKILEGPSESKAEHTGDA